MLFLEIPNMELTLCAPETFDAYIHFLLIGWSFSMILYFADSFVSQDYVSTIIVIIIIVIVIIIILANAVIIILPFIHFSFFIFGIMTTD